MKGVEGFADLMIAASSGMRSAHREILDEWRPEEPPVTTLFAALGYRIAEDFDSSSIDANRQLFALIEGAMESGDQDLVMAVATGLIEALATRALQKEDLWKRIVPLLGPRSLDYAKAWLRA